MTTRQLYRTREGDLVTIVHVYGPLERSGSMGEENAFATWVRVGFLDAAGKHKRWPDDPSKLITYDVPLDSLRPEEG